ncbi:hypothetical protein GCK72_003115 [Caenorhabditis remanei]|uniref:F-box domain-containing protein n=1 Tax=Caenorhabditis remanei TaxID=31234 RepID=A0A6A5HU71_CAERE|nr:hypothetical protein GCK72_003115 [Caenorhabditis remanei]KAF1771289.1 hypothetical protein GCK72_003115 [Caenorhabditis remanei]
MPPFPLLRLPQLVLCEVFKSLSIREKIKLSFCSKKISMQINNARLYSENITVNLGGLYQKIEVSSKNYKEPFEISIRQDPRKTFNSKTQQFFIACYTNGITIYWKNYREGFLTVTRHISKMFQCKISISDNYHSGLYQPVVSELYDLQQEFKTFTIEFDGSEDQKLLWNQISSKLELVENLRILSIPYFDFRHFRPVFTSWPQNITIMKSDWFTLESLSTCTCTRITLDRSHVGNKDLDGALKKWKSGGFPNLNRLAINSLWSTKNDEQILGMNWRELNGVVLLTDDGSKKATINFRHGRICFDSIKLMSTHLPTKMTGHIVVNVAENAQIEYAESHKSTGNELTVLIFIILIIVGGFFAATKFL